MKLYIIAILLLFCAFTVCAQKMNLPADAVQRVEQQVNKMLNKPELKDGSCEKITNFQNWKNIELDKCDYTRKKDKTGLKKHATVVVHIPTTNQLARWLVAACVIANGSASTKCTNFLVDRIVDQSGGQFPVAGIVYEDMEKDGYEKAWNFRDGVTVVIENGIDNSNKYQQPTDEQINSSLTGKILKTGKYGLARIQGTTREEYISSCKIDNNCVSDTKNIGSTNERTVKWVDVVRQLYQAALESDRNDLIIAWARNNKLDLK